MNEATHFLKTIENEIEKWIPGQSIDCVVLGFEENTLKVLLLKWKQVNRWSLPGGFIYKDENMDSAAVRILEERMGLKSIFLSQFHTFGDFGRRDKEELKEISGQLDNSISRLGKWLTQRFITTGYIAFADIRKANPKPDFLSEKCEWVDIHQLPVLIFDHQHIISYALNFIRIRLNYVPFGKSLLQQKFTMSELQKLYESILGKNLDRANFQKKMLKLGIFNREEKLLLGTANKAPYLYSFHNENYEMLIKKGIGYL